MNVTQQIDCLTRLGARLGDWVRREDLAGIDFFGDRLGRGPETHLQYPALFMDVLRARLVRVKDHTTQKPVPLIVGPAQRDFSRRATDKNIILKSGKTWFTTDIATRNFIRIITRPGRTALLVAHDKSLASDFFSQGIHFALENIPGKLGEVLRAGALRTEEASARQLYFPELNSRYFVGTAGSKVAGLGQGYQHLQCTEVSRWEGNVQQLHATLTSHLIGDVTTEDLEARPFGDHGFFHDTYQEAKAGASSFRAHFYEWWWNPAHIARPVAGFTATEEEAALCKRYAKWFEAHTQSGLKPQLTNAQLQWRRDKAVELKDLAGQEFGEDDIACFLGSGDCPFHATSMASILERGTAPLESEIVPGAEENGLMIWEKPHPGEDYILFADVAGGMGTSRPAIEIINKMTGEQAAEWTGRESAEAFGARVKEYGRRWNNALVAVENNLGDISATVLAALHDYPKLFWHELKRPNGSIERRRGWHTDAATRPMMFETLQDVLICAPHLFHSRRLVRDMKLHVRNGDRIEPKKGSKAGDLTIAMAGAHSVRARAGRTAQPWAIVVKT